MTVYIRTDEGQIAAYNTQSALPRKLKSLLKLIDGKTSLAMQEESLRAFGDVRGLMQSLDAAGLIRPAEGGLKSGRSTTDPSSVAQRADALRQAKTMMANFVLTHLPDQSFSILKELEALASLEQLAATLGGYEQVVSQIGPASRDHLLQVKQILREHL